MSKVIPISAVDIRAGAAAWAWAEENAVRIARAWKQAQGANPALYDGRVLMLAHHEVADGRLVGETVETGFSAFLTWKEQGMPEAGVRNVFGCAVVMSGDGHLLFGRMGPATAGAGRVYPMAGTPEPADLKDGSLDIEGSIVRELREETGLDAGEAKRDAGYLMIEEAGLLALAAVLRFEAPSRELKGRMMAHIETCEHEELDEIVVFRRAAFHVHHRMPGFARILVQHLIA